MISCGSVSLQTGGVEPVEIQLFSSMTHQPLVSKTDIQVSVRRQQDDWYLDWDDNTFKLAVDVTRLWEGMEEVNHDNRKGLYRLNTPEHAVGLHTAAITNPGVDDIYDVTIRQYPGTDAEGLPMGFEIKMGSLADKIYGLPTSVVNAVWDEMQADHTLAGSFGDLLRRVVALQKENYYIDKMTYSTRGLLLTGRMRLFPDKATALGATENGLGEGEFATYTFISTEVPGHSERAETVRSIRDS